MAIPQSVFSALLVIGYLASKSDCQISEGCPTNDFVSFDGTDYCYAFSTTTNLLSWFEANAQCAALYREATLASVVTQEENDFIFSSMQTTTINFYWIGLYKIASGDSVGQLRWIDGSPYPNPDNWNNFESGQPDNVTGSGNDCVSMNKASNGGWSDESCTSQRGYACKVPKLSIQTGTCPDGFSQTGGRCYYVNTDGTTTFNAAIQTCQNLGGPGAFLASITNEPENTYIFNLMSDVPDAQKAVWIGLRRCGGNVDDLDNDWFWYDETPVGDFDDWAPYQPDGDGDCAAANMGLESGFSRWEEVDCTTDAGVFCKAPSNGAPCTVGWTANPDDGTYCYYVNPSFGLTQAEAAQWCIAHGIGATLGSMADSIEASFVNALAQNTGTTDHSFWIGLYRYIDDAPWTWMDGSSKAIVKWNDGEPTNDVATDLCATTGLQLGTWFSSDCGRGYPFACKAYPANPDDCAANGFELFQGACYLFVGDTTMSNDAAFQACKTAWQISSLVSLLTTDENDYVYQRMLNVTTVAGATDYWIGYQRCDPGDQIFNSWTWLDTNQQITENDYQNFVLPVGEENCAMMNSLSNWTDYNCNSGRGYVCEVTALATTTTTSTSRPTTTTRGADGTTTMGPTTTAGGGGNSEGASDDGGLSSGDVVGIVFGVIIGIALIAAAGIFGYIYFLKPRMAAGGGSASKSKDTTAFAFSNTTYSDGVDDA